MRVWLVFVLILSFALQGAAAQTSRAPCPMEAEMAMANLAADPSAATANDCCNDMATFLLTGQACKTGQECQAPLTGLLLPVPDKTALAVHQTAPVLHTLAAPSAVAPAVWRPPIFH